ncbi:oxidoreductase [Alkalicoccus luteus]|uniref:oxidoreductase n=1 Tax=Alkalicoccus luteus TaxID=1237094 RepID=UPI004033D593
MSEQFYAFQTEGEGTGSLIQRNKEDLPQGEVLIKVHYSGVNYKDGLALHKKAKIAKDYPMVPGIDLAGTVEHSESPDFSKGQRVICTSYDLGTAHDGGYSQFARVPAAWVVPLPENLSLRESMIIGTAGFTAALSIHRLEQNGLTSEDKPILVTGASGGVGSMAVDMLAGRGYHVTASTGRLEEEAYLKKLGAAEVIDREEVTPEKIRPLDKQKWAAAVDPTGGSVLAAILSSVKQHGSVAVSGLTAGVEVPTTVMPFILRGVDLLGIDSAYCPMPLRKEVWSRCAGSLKPSHMEETATEIGLDGIQQALHDILKSKIRGRVIIDVQR